MSAKLIQPGSLKIANPGEFQFVSEETGIVTTGRFDLFLIRRAWFDGCDFEDVADGFGPGLGTMGGDWSGIRDSTEDAVMRMTERAMNWFFPAHR